ncbi:MAG TPA: F0F1 ATP synthase subunit A [Kofleriaceae bacterium]|nr:F0F1 ATP synthase subunit A [Kofleriaceae bacterium]
MGEHGTWFDYLNRFGWWRDLSVHLHHALGVKKTPFGEDSFFTLTPVLGALVVVLFTIWGGMKFYRGLQGKDGGIVPARTMNLRNFFEYMTESVYGMVEGAMGEANAARFFPLIGALWFFILFSNLFALIPGFTPPTDTLKTNVGLAIMVFFLTHYYGVKEHGLAYFKHFLGPVPALAPLMLIIETISHIARPLSLSVRLMGNMVADHKVTMVFFALVPLVVPLPFLLLGLLVCLIQALVFCTLTMVYIGMAIEHEEH